VNYFEKVKRFKFDLALFIRGIGSKLGFSSVGALTLLKSGHRGLAAGASLNKASMLRLKFQKSKNPYLKKY